MWCSCQLNIPFHLLLFNEEGFEMHKAWSNISGRVNPKYPPNQCDESASTQIAFVQPLHDFFAIADGIHSEFHESDKFDNAKNNYFAACQKTLDATEAYRLSTCDVDEASKDLSTEDTDLLVATQTKKQEELKGTTESKSQCVDHMVVLLGTLQFRRPNNDGRMTLWPYNFEVDWGKITTEDGQLLPQREVKLGVVIPKQDIAMTTQDIWQQTEAIQVRHLHFGNRPLKQHAAHVCFVPLLTDAV